MQRKSILISSPITPLNAGLPSAKTAIVVALLLAIFPWVMQQMDADFYIVMGSRILILALAASALNLALGYGGMVSLGHAAFFGVGGYSAALLYTHGVGSVWAGMLVAVLAAGLFAYIIGVISLRTKGVYFIMITLAFAQLVYLMAISFSALGGDDGIMLAARASMGRLNIESDIVFYYLVFSISVLAYFFMYRLVGSRFGRALVAIRENESRMAAIGYPTFALKLTAFVISGILAGLAGALMANLGHGITPHSLDWHQSGLLMVMVILGGVGNFWGGLIGAGLFMLLEEVISEHTEHWNLFLGALLLVIVMFVPNGVMTVRQRIVALINKGRSQ
jgi:branched-chain amino acid transport system permease protein